MNKFGIFSFLNSFLNSYINNSNKKDGESTENKENIFNTFSKLFNNNAKENTETAKPKEPTPPPAYMPLQKDMLNVMASHDEIVKRVLKKWVVF